MGIALDYPGDWAMRTYSPFLPMAVFATGLAVVGLTAVSAPVLAQQPQGQQVQVQLPPALQAALRSGNSDLIVRVLSAQNLPLNNPDFVRQVAITLGTATVGKTELSSVISGAIGAIMKQAGANDVAILQAFGAGLVKGAAETADPSKVLAFTQDATAAMVAGAGGGESKVGLVARAVSSGVVETLVGLNVPAPVIAGLVQTGVAQGASKVVGSEVRVAVDSTDVKPVSDVTLTRQDTGKVLEKGKDVNFITLNRPEEGPKQEVAQTVEQKTSASPF